MLRLLIRTPTILGSSALPAAAASPFFHSSRGFNMNRSVQSRWEMENQAVAQKRTDYDFDHEQWQRQMKFASMDCIMDPDITPIKYTTLMGIRKAFRRYVTMKKLVERRPDFAVDNLQPLFIQWKVLSHSKDLEDSRNLQRLTTHNEAHRMTQDIQKRLNAEFANKSWRAIKSGCEKSTYEIEVDASKLVTCYMGQMTNDDWVQVTVKYDFRERSGPTAEWIKGVEYAVFEVRLGDGVKTLNNNPFIVVGVMKKDGTRYGKDSQDAQTLRKQFDRANSKWF